MSEPCCARGFGLIVIGTEVLDGRCQDRHFGAAQEILAARRLDLLYSLTLPDEPVTIREQLVWAMARPDPFFCCGGIGSTPDDYTRGCAAAAAGVGLELHPEGMAILRERFGETIAPGRIKMVEFPVGATLIPNPVNRIPGFAIRNGFFLPGFPSMARPMMEWVLDSRHDRGPETVRCTLRLPGAREGDLVELMEQFVTCYADVSFSSLPSFTTGGGTEVRIGLRGGPARVAEAERFLVAALDAAGVVYRNE